MGVLEALFFWTSGGSILNSSYEINCMRASSTFLKEDLELVLDIARRRAAMIEELGRARQAQDLERVLSVVDRLTGDHAKSNRASAREHGRTSEPGTSRSRPAAI